MENDEGAKVLNGEIIVVDSSKEERITIKARKNVKLFINDKECDIYKVYEVTSSDKITYTCEKTESIREANVIISEDKMKVYINVVYTPETEYKLKDREAFLNLAISTEIVSQKEPEHFTIFELKKILKEKGVVYGINEEQLQLAAEGCVQEFLIAKGKKPVKDIPSEVKLFFTPTQMVFPEIDSNDNFDYKNLFRISNVNAGDRIAKIIPEVIGEDGINVFGKAIKREYIRKMPINILSGCKVEDSNIIALIDGKAHIANNNVSVNPIYTVESVNMNTCNIKFYGDIEVYDSVDDNMSVNAGGSLDVSQNVNTSSVVTGGEITILGNAINSKILSGQIDIRKKEYSDVLTEFRDVVLKMIDSINELSINSLKFETSDLIRTLTEKNFGDFQKVALNIVSLNIKNKTKHNKLVDFIKDKVLGYNILNMKSLNDLVTLLNILENEIDYYDKHIIVPLDIRVGYCQDCSIKSTGNIVIGGRGEYISELTAMKDILFTRSDSVARGGILSAGENISAGIVGSKAHIPTTLIVPTSGKISAAVAFKNTIFCFGKTRMILEETYENINAHYNEETRRIEISKSSL
ncbi:hypothetical protein psyc5s11_39170 [Clostridium gelidum]|uniref:Flagellar Assembly Protein A N-terminal region domain-containing protein n=1 Tax=Clostridium gelidum TaxID=704125 RepID=A0ABN6J0I1_9CLOT|nr:FapA family protein [Clostridium gelidum]BCZ47850.1 hypothetical protein psyc5s11_39170 [Clostridium gelidum]